jgi:hypothetical protein
MMIHRNYLEEMTNRRFIGGFFWLIVSFYLTVWWLRSELLGCVLLWFKTNPQLDSSLRWNDEAARC